MKLVVPHVASAALLIPAVAGAQSFVNNTTEIPTGGAPNSSFSENVSFADVDQDGDQDAIFADGGDLGNDRNRIWINQGGLQAGTVGVFVDETATRIPAIQDASRDIDFADIDGDGDLDFAASNTSGVSLQGNRFYINMGGAQAGTPGFFTEGTAATFSGVGINDGSTMFSSVDAGQVLPDGNFVDWSCDTGFADLDNDGDPDYINATYGDLSEGKVPTRIFLNEGGVFEEFNPSGFQLTGVRMVNGDPALWCEGVQKHKTTDTTGVEADVNLIAISIDFGDIDGDFDIDILHGEKFDEPRVFQNRTMEAGELAFRDMSYAVLPGPVWAPGLGSYEQEMGDFDLDGDLDIYGANWQAGPSGRDDSVFLNSGGTFAAPFFAPDSFQRHNEPAFIDYDADGDLDVFIASETYLERLYENTGAAGSWALVDQTSELPVENLAALGADTCDVDQDGDYDIFTANDVGAANLYFENVVNVSDTTAPRLPTLEQAADRAAGFDPTVVRVHVYDNTNWDVAQYYDVDLEVSVDGGVFAPSDMVFSGGQVFRGEIAGMTEGVIDYRVRATDDMGNVGLSSTLQFSAGPCNGDPIVYCTAKVNSLGCTPSIGWSGTAPSMSQASGFFVEVTNTLANKTGLFFYGYEGKQVPYQAGWLCVQAPSKRTALQSSGGVAPSCNGMFSYDFNARIASGLDPSLASGVTIYGQFWSRDPQVPFKTTRTDAIQFTICP
jgi:hypothetical protein